MDFALIVLSWAVVLVGPWFKYPQMGAPYSLETFVLCVSMPVAFMVPSFLLGAQGGAEFRRSPRLKLGVLLLTSLCSFASVGCFALAYSGLAGLDVNTAKDLYATQQVEPNKIYWRAALLLSPAIPVFLYGCLQRAGKAWGAILIVFLVWVAAILGSRFGARYDFLCFIALFIAGAYWLHEGYIRGNKLRIACLTCIGVLCFVAANIAFSFQRNAPSASMNDYQSVLADGQVVLDGLGLVHFPDAVAYAAGILDDYLLSSVSRCEIYLENHREDPGYGQVMFYIPAQQIGWDSGSDIKRGVDDIYRAIGIKMNIWATGVREIHMDFGWFGSIGFIFVTGLLYAFCKQLSGRSFFAGVCGVIILAFSLFLPFGCIWKSPFLQVGLLVLLSALLLDVVAKEIVTKATCVTGNPSTRAAP